MASKEKQIAHMIVCACVRKHDILREIEQIERMADEDPKAYMELNQTADLAYKVKQLEKADYEASEEIEGLVVALLAIQ